MKIIFVDNCYPVFIRSIESELKEAKKDLSYGKILEFYYKQFFGTSDYYSRNIHKLGWEASDIIINFPSAQNAWLKENRKYSTLLSSRLIEKVKAVQGVYASTGNPLALIAQIKSYRPDVLYIQCPATFPPFITKILKRYCKLLVGQIASPLPADEFFKHYDLVLSSLPNIVEHIKRTGIKSEYFKIGFEASILNHINKLPKPYEITHVGGYGTIHNQRNEVLEFAAQKLNIDFWGYGENNLKSNSAIRKNFHGQAWGLEMYNILASSRITLTGHISSVAGEYANNMTLYEATGCGALLMTDWKKNLNEIFEIDKEIVAYSDKEDLVKKIKYYLDHPKEAEKIAKAGQQRTLKDHTYQNRMLDLDLIIKRHLNHGV
jgi:spore maturation protein CgeB